jgi:hypothetical protein
MREEATVVPGRRSENTLTFARPARAAALFTLVALGGLGSSFGCRRGSPPETPPATAAPAEAAVEPADEAPADDASPGASPSVDPVTQLRWQALAKGEGAASPAPPEGAPPSDAARPAGAADKAPLNSEAADLRNYWQDKVNEARGPLEYAQATRRQDCPALPPGRQRTPDEQSYCADLERAEQLAKEKYDAARQEAARAGFSVQ